MLVVSLDCIIAAHVNEQQVSKGWVSLGSLSSASLIQAQGKQQISLDREVVLCLGICLWGSLR